MISFRKPVGYKNKRKPAFNFRIALILLLSLSMSPLACTPFLSEGGAVDSAAIEGSTTTAAVGLAATSLLFIAEADAQVNEANPSSNYGISTYLQVDGGTDPEVESFLRFTVVGIPGSIQTARLRVYDTTNASTNGPAVYATGTSWTETGITWRTRPARIGSVLDNKGSISTNTWVEYDVTAAVSGNGTFSFVLAADSNDAATFSSRQGSQPPQLVITLADGMTATPTPTMGDTSTDTATPTATSSATSTSTAVGSSLTFTANADAYVKQSNPSTNYGSAATLQVDGASDPDTESFLRFAVSGISGTVQNAQLRVFATTNGTRNGPAIYATGTSWLESAITWNRRPARTSGAVDNKGNISTGTWVEYNVTSLVTGNGTFSFVLAADSSDAVVFSSRQGNQPPQLVITMSGGTTSTPTPTPSQDSTATPTTSGGAVTFVGAGDISECGNDNDELTAKLLDGIPGTVFTTGDNAYDSGTMNQYLSCYDPTWGRHKDRTKPVPGNHEYLTAGAAGYFQYFNNVPSYYAYNLGSWRIYALNSEISVSATSAQVTWLKEDLAANPSQCVLAYWHQPRWSSGKNHGNGSEYQALWQVLYEAGADLVLNGHEHNYERFAEMNASGAAVSGGMREIVVGTGGKSHYDFATPLPGSEIRNSDTYGVLKLTLRATGYDWEFIPVEGSTFTDSGSSNCH